MSGVCTCTVLSFFSSSLLQDLDISFFLRRGALDNDLVEVVVLFYFGFEEEYDVDSTVDVEAEWSEIEDDVLLMMGNRDNWWAFDDEYFLPF